MLGLRSYGRRLDARLTTRLDRGARLIGRYGSALIGRSATALQSAVMNDFVSKPAIRDQLSAALRRRTEAAKERLIA